MAADAVVVGSGPNGLAAAVTLARAGLAVEVLEANAWIGGGAATRETTLDGFRHDLASAVHPMALGSPFFRAFGLERRVDLLVPDSSFAHPVAGRVAVAHRDLERTASALGRDGPAYARLMAPLARRADELARLLTGALLAPPMEPTAALAIAAATGWQGTPAWRAGFHEAAAPALLTGAAAHTIGRHPRPSTAGSGLLLGALAHARGWPVPRGGSQAISDALADDLRRHGGAVRTGVEIRSLAELDGYDLRLLDVSARGLDRLGGDRLPRRYRRALRALRPGPGVCKIDAALDGPIPWSDPVLADVPTVHLGGTREHIRDAEDQVLRGRLPQRPYVLLVQPSVIDPTRAPAGKGVLWAYTHVPYGCPVDRSEVILDTIEAYAPGLRDRVLASTVTTADRLERVSANFAGGDFAAGAMTMRQLLARPVASPTPWRTPLPGTYLCSAATSPGPAVHGMSGWHAARTALADCGLSLPDLGPTAPT